MVTAVLAEVIFLEEKLGFMQIFGVYLVIFGILGVNHFGHDKFETHRLFSSYLKDQKDKGTQYIYP